MLDVDSAKQDVFDYVRYSLGDQMMDVELDPAHYESAFKYTLARYRQRSTNAVEESYSFLSLVLDQTEYTLPSEVISVRGLFKRNIGAASGTSTQFEPFEAGFMNAYMMQNSKVGGLANFYMYHSYVELAQKMLGGVVNYHYNSSSKVLKIMRRPRGEEDVLLWTFNYKPDFVIVNDPYVGPWIKDYVLALCMRSLGNARSKFATIVGPGGGTSLNGDRLLNDSATMLERLEIELNNFMDNGQPYSFIVG